MIENGSKKNHSFGISYFLVVMATAFVSINSYWFLQKENVLLAFREEGQGEDISENSVFEERSIVGIGNVGEGIFGARFPIAPSQPIRKEDSYDLAISNAHASVVIDVDSGTILHYDNGKKRRQIASLTKLMTAVIVIEEIDNLDEDVVIDEEAVYVEGTKVGCPRSGYCISERLRVGEKISARSLLKAMLMNSANDSAIALAKHISGSQEAFSKLMNKKAKSLGLMDSNFCTPSGLEIDGEEDSCYSTAYDIARIGAYSMKHDIIWETLRIPEATIYSADGKFSHDILNTDRLLGEMQNCLGGKTGFTPLAGQSLLLAAIDPTKKHRIVAVVLDDPYRWQDIREMIDWSFDSYNWE